MFGDNLIDIVIAGYKLVDRSWTKHYTDFVYPQDRIYYISEGIGQIETTNGIVVLEPGYMYLIPAFTIINLQCDDYMGNYFVSFNADDIMKLHLMYYGTEITKIMVSNPNEIKRLFENIKLHFEANDMFSLLNTNGSMYLLMAPFFKKDPVQNSNLGRFINVIEYIDRYIHTSISVKDLALIMDLEPVYFSNLFSKTFGTPPKQYIIQKRLQQSQKLLATTTKKIKEIAKEVGFDNDMYFSRIFHKRVGMTPGEYRRISHKIY